MNNNRILSRYDTSDKNKWGPYYWFVFHNFAANYPTEPSNIEKEVAHNLLRSIPFLLPCSECATDSFTYIRDKLQNTDFQNDQYVKNKSNLIMFMVEFHNHVNRKINKPILDI